MTTAPYTPAADALDALAGRISFTDLTNPKSLLCLADVFDEHAKAAEICDIQAAVRIERMATHLRSGAAERDFRPPSAGERADLAAGLRHQAVFVRRVEATLGKQRPAAAPVLDFTGALAKRRDAEAAARRQKTARVIDRVTGWPHPDFGPDEGDAA